MPGFQINGETDNNGTTSLLSCQQSLRAVRAISAANNQVGIGVAWQQGHINPVWGEHQSGEFAYYMASEVLKARRALAGGDVVSSNGFVEYPELTMESGWLGKIQDFVTDATVGNAPHGRDIKRVSIAPYASYAA
ncbi:MAG TPA: hypothetical protein PLE35_14315, partial [Lentisphaeria bacterium]|nr:hypothetical protein [Lentisphaeria bacterium]